MRSISKKSNLDRLKQQVQQTSNQQYQIQTQKDELEQTVACKKQELDSNQDAMRQLIRSVFAQNEVAAAKEKEQLNDRLDKFAYNQQVMNQQIIELNCLIFCTDLICKCLSIFTPLRLAVKSVTVRLLLQEYSICLPP